MPYKICRIMAEIVTKKVQANIGSEGRVQPETILQLKKIAIGDAGFHQNRRGGLETPTCLKYRALSR